MINEYNKLALCMPECEIMFQAACLRHYSHPRSPPHAVVVSAHQSEPVVTRKGGLALAGC